MHFILDFLCNNFYVQHDLLQFFKDCSFVIDRNGQFVSPSSLFCPNPFFEYLFDQEFFFPSQEIDSKFLPLLLLLGMREDPTLSHLVNCLVKIEKENVVKEKEIKIFNLVNGYLDKLAFNDLILFSNQILHLNFVPIVWDDRCNYRPPHLSNLAHVAREQERNLVW